MPFFPPPAPLWLADLAEALAQQRFNSEGVAEMISILELLKVREEILKWTEKDMYTQWTHWFFADRSTRAISPSSAMTVPEYIQRRIEQGTRENLQEAICLSPTNSLAMARLALRILRAPELNSRQEGEVDFYSKRAVELSPDDPEVKTIRAVILKRLDSANSKQGSPIVN